MTSLSIKFDFDKWNLVTKSWYLHLHMRAALGLKIKKKKLGQDADPEDVLVSSCGLRKAGNHFFYRTNEVLPCLQVVT